jgi:hypothetical protein
VRVVARTLAKPLRRHYMAKTKMHDINIRIEDDKLKIVAYKLKLQKNSNEIYFDTDTRYASGKVFECPINHKPNQELIAYVLDSEYWNETRTYWDGYSDWQTTEFLTIGDVPARIAKWMASLPEYQLTIGD